MRKQRKISVTVSPELVDDLDYISSRTGVSRSALISELLSPGAAEMREILERVPVDPTPADALRLRGESAQIIRDQLEKLQELEHDLFSGL